MPEEQTKINAEPVVDVPTEGDSVDIELNEDSKKTDIDNTEPKIEIKEESSKDELDEYRKDKHS